ncbi:MAG TPA: hypothetical protein VJ961_06285 [Mariprofundaceae bacterium]|nr:hypothetical protein [Mariprofundaceae bacterium]
MLSGCETMQNMAKSSDSGSAKSSSATAQDSGKATPPPVITEFGDIPIPPELKRDDSQSFVYEAPNVVIGVMTYTGRVTAPSVSEFFRGQMPEQGWKFVNAYKDNDIDLFFMKGNRSCQISIKPSMLTTKVIIKVGPSG